MGNGGGNSKKVLRRQRCGWLMCMASTKKTTTSAKSFRLKTNGTNDGGKYVSRDNEALSFSAQRDCQLECTDTIHHFCFSWWCFRRTLDPMVHLRQSLCSVQLRCNLLG